MKKVVATGKTSLSNNTEMHVGSTPPLYPVEGQLWLNTSTQPPVLYKWDGKKWVLQEMDVEKLDPELIGNINGKIDEKHTEVLNEIQAINEAAEQLKADVEARNKQDDQYFSDMRQTIINNRYEALGWYEENDGRISGIAQSVDGITTRVGKAETNISTLTQTAQGLQSTVTSITNGTHSVITQMSDRINLRVEKGNIVSQINASTEGLYLAGKLIYLDGNVKVDGTFTAPKVISTNSDNTEYSKIEGRKITSYGYYSGTWTDGYVAGYHSLTANLGYIAMKQETGSWSNNSQPTLYYTARGISTYFGASSSASGTIEFFASGYSSSANSLRIKSSGNIILESTASSGSNIFINPKGASVYICDDGYSNYYSLTAKNLIATGYVSASGGNISSTSTDKFYFGNFYTNDTNINSKNDAIKIGGGTGNIVCTKLTETSAREKKKNITPFEKDATAIINNSYIRNYQYLDDKDIDLPYVGLILDEAPLEVVDTFGNGVLPSNATFVAWKAIQELSARIEQLEGKVA